MLVSPAEPLSLRALGETSGVPERFGADFLFATKAGLVGVQRKEIGDLANSQRDGRVRKELAQMEHLQIGIWMIEGEWRWTSESVSLAVRGYTKTQYHALCWLIQSKGYWILPTTSLADSIVSLSNLASWLRKEQHSSAGARPKPSGSWGRATSRDWCIHLLESFEGIGPKQAAAIYDHFGRLPLRWDCTMEDLLGVKGIGNKRVLALMESLEGNDD